MKKLPIRSIICAPKDYYLISADLSQAETWVVAYLANEQKIKDALANGKKSLGTDIHSVTAIWFYNIPEGVLPSDQQRYVGKKGNHQCSYRGGPYKLAESINKESDKPPFVTVSVAEAKQLHQRWLELFGKVQLWWFDIEEKIRRDRTLVTCYRRQHKFYGMINDSLFKEATAFEPQSTIADHMLGAVQPELGIKGGLKGIYNNIVSPSKGEIRLTNTAHDSAILEVPKSIYREVAERVIKELKRPMMIKGEEFTVPVDIEYGEHWNEGMEKIKT